MLWIIFKKPLFFPLVVCILLAGKIYAGDGSVGTTSSTTSTISISKVSGVQLTGLEDILFGSVNSVPGTYYFDVCVFSSTGSYTVTASGYYGNGTLFQLGDLTESYFMVYDVSWNDTASGLSGTNLDNWVTSGTFTGAHTSSTTCGGSDNARVFINIDATSFATNPPSTYQDGLYITIAPI